MKSAALAALVVAAMTASGAHAASTTITNSDNCKTVHLKPGENPPTGTGMSTSITAGNGTVSGQTTTGNGVSVHSSGSGVGTSVATSTSSDGRTTTVTSANGNCTVYVQPNK
ncbi:MAG: hypothetical protein ACTHLO_06145 [Pseudolabrys sp.]